MTIPPAGEGIQAPPPPQPVLAAEPTIGETPQEARRWPSALFEVVMCSAYPTQVFVGLALAAGGLAATNDAGELSLTWVVTLSLADSLLLLGLVFLFLHRSGDRPTDVFLGPRPWRGEILLGLWLIPVFLGTAMVMLLALHAVWPGSRSVPENPLGTLLESPVGALVFSLVAIAAGGIREELQRAFILHRFEQHLGGAWVGLVVFSVAFGLGHLVQGWDAVVVTGLLGALWGVVYLTRRSTLPTMISHAGFNLAQILLALTGFDGSLGQSS